MNESRSLKYFRLWMQLASSLAARACDLLANAADRDETRGGETITGRDWRRKAEQLATRRWRAINRADEALARVSPLRVSGGAS